MIKPRTLWLAAEALRNIQFSRTRIVLTLVGIVISTASVVAILTIGWNAANESVRRFSSLGANLFVVSNLEQGQVALYADMEAEKQALRARFPFVQGAAWVFSLSSRAKGGARQADAVLYAGDAQFRPMVSPQWRQDGPSAGVWVGAGLLAELGLPARPGPDVGLRLEGRYYPVAGVFAELDNIPFVDIDARNAVILPASATRHLFPGPAFARMLIRAPAAQVNESTASALRGYFVQRGFVAAEVNYPAKIIESLKTQQQLFAWLLAGVALISVVVAAVGVMSSTLSDLADRRREIAIRLIVGASVRDIFWMLSVEALALSLLGAAGGVVVGLLCAALAAWLAGWAFAVHGGYVLLAVLCSSSICLGFSLFPVRYLMRPSIVEALRAES